MATFTDDFNRADSSDLGAGWVEVSGNWSIVSGQLSPGVDTGTVILRAAAAMDTSDNYAQATIAAGASGSRGVWCRGNSNITTGYLWRNDGATWDLFSVVSSTFNVIGTYAAAAAPGDVARVQAVGSTIKAFVNGIERVSVTNSAVTTGTSVGIRSDTISGTRWDNFTGADVTAGATLGGAAETGTAQPLTAAKAAALNPAGTQEAAQGLPGAKTADLSPADAADEAQPFTAAKTAVLGPAAVHETALPLAGAKTGALGAAGETDAARPLTAPATDDDVDLTLGAPYSPWAVSAPHGSGWEVGAPA